MASGPAPAARGVSTFGKPAVGQHRFAVFGKLSLAIMHRGEALGDKLQDMENELRGRLRNFGLEVGLASPGQFEARIKRPVTGPGLVYLVSNHEPGAADIWSWWTLNVYSKVRNVVHDPK